MKRFYFFSLLMMICCVIAKSQYVVVDGITYMITSNGTAILTNGKQAKGDVVVANEVSYNDESYQVAAIGDGAFYHNTDITSVKIPATVVTIQRSAFYGCIRLSSVTALAEKFDYIGTYPFYDTPWVKALPKDDGVTYWKDWMLDADENKQWDELYVKEGTRGMCVYNLRAKTVYIPKSYTETFFKDSFVAEKIVVDNANPVYFSDDNGAVYGRQIYAEYYCAAKDERKNITAQALVAISVKSQADKLILADGVKYLNTGACMNGNFEEVVVPEGCVAVFTNNFRWLKRCKRIVLPSTIEFFDMYDPMGDADMEVVLKAKEVPDNSGNQFTFGDCSHVTLYVPAESLDKYLADAAYQGKFKAIKAIPDDKIVGDVDCDGTINSADVVAVYNYITSGADSGIELSSADVNGDNVVNSGDVVEVYNLIINGTAQSK